MKSFTDFIKGMFIKEHLVKRVLLCVAAVLMMGFCLSWLLLVDLGTDPYTSFNVVVSDMLGVSLGTWQSTFNCMLFVIVIIWGRDMIGIGTVANMFIVGYSIDFFSWVLAKVVPEGLFDSMAVRVGVMIPTLAVFVIAVGVYIDVQLGTSPYDAIPHIVFHHQNRLSYKVIRCILDLSVAVIAFLLGAKIGIVTIIMGFTLGPVISLVGKWISPMLGIEADV